MISAQSEKELSGRWENFRKAALYDATTFPKDGRFGLDDLDFDNNSPNGDVQGTSRFSELNYKLSTETVDSIRGSLPLKVDVRKLPDRE